MKRLHLIALFAILTFAQAIAQEKIDLTKPLVNQSGYNLGEAKRFVYPAASSSEGKEFSIINLRTGEVEYKSRAIYGEGWFSEFNPVSTDEYVIEIDGKRSVPFVIGDHYIQRISSKLAYDFFIDVRGSEDPVNSNEKNVWGGGPSRDCGSYGLEALFEVLLYASNPALFDNWTNEIGDKTRADLIDLILWHAEFAYHHREFNQPIGNRFGTLGYPGAPRMKYDYWNTLDHLAPVCAAYHTFLKPHISEELYQTYRKACLDKWEAYDRHKEVRYWVFSAKWVDYGFQEFSEMGNAFGQGLFRNLFMYLCEKNEPEGEPEKFLKWAQECAQDIISNWDFKNPRHMWWMRNAEHITPQALAFFLMVAPEHAPQGTKEKLQQWAIHIKQRTNNPWRYRSHSEEEMAHDRTKELGGAPALAGSMFAVAHLTDDIYLKNLGWAQVDFVFGANPCGAHMGHKSAERVELGYWEGVEHGWIASHPNGAAKLGRVRGTLDGTPLNAHFKKIDIVIKNPTHIDGDTIDADAYATEGWAVSNRGWMASLTFSTLSSHRMRILNTQGEPITSAKRGEQIRIELKAALNQDYTAIDKGWIELSLDQQTPTRIEVVETAPNSGLFEATYTIPKKCKKLSASYGYLGFEKSAEIEIK